jgi:acyl-CoA thioesterase II
MSSPPPPADVAAPRERDRKLVERMVELLNLQQVDADRFQVPGLSTEARRVFGGQLVGQAVAAATRTVDPGRMIHSTHAYFVRAGDTTAPTEFQVFRDGDGGATSFRRVVVTQNERVLVSLSAAYQTAYEGWTHQPKPPRAPAPETLDDDYVQATRMPHIDPRALSLVGRASPLQFRSPKPEQRLCSEPAPAAQQFWFRVAAPLPDDPALHRTVLAYASDVMLLGVGLMPHGMRWFGGDAKIASLDHALWFHGDVRMDDWLFYEQESPWSGEGRGLNRGHIYDRRGRLVATVAQEGAMRRI